jgi:hypothetical protein
MTRNDTLSRGRKLSNPNSEMTRLKLLWRNSLPEAERDYWREQLVSTRTQAALREEVRDKHGIQLLHDRQIRRFRDWVEDEDRRKQQADEVEWDRAELEEQGLAGELLRAELVRRMTERALARGDYKLGATAVTLDLKVERLGIAERRLALQVRRAERFDKAADRAVQPGGLTPEVLRQIERDLNLM